MSIASRRASFVRSRTPLTDAEFATGLGLSGAPAALLCAVRRVVARMCRVEPELIHGDERPRMLASIMQVGWHSGWDEVWFLTALEEELRTTLPDWRLPTFLGRWILVWIERGPERFDAWALSVARWLEGHHDPRGRTQGAPVAVPGSPAGRQPG